MSHYINVYKLCVITMVGKDILTTLCKNSCQHETAAMLHCNQVGGDIWWEKVPAVCSFSY